MISRNPNLLPLARTSSRQKDEYEYEEYHSLPKSGSNFSGKSSGRFQDASKFSEVPAVRTDVIDRFNDTILDKLKSLEFSHTVNVPISRTKSTSMKRILFLPPSSFPVVLPALVLVSVISIITCSVLLSRNMQAAHPFSQREPANQPKSIHVDESIVPLHCLRSNPRWSSCVFKRRQQDKLPLCAAYKACDHELHISNNYEDLACRGQFGRANLAGSAAWEHACCVEVWWPVNSTAEKPYMNEQLIGKYLQQHCAVTLRSLYPVSHLPDVSDPTEQSPENIEGTFGRVVVIVHHRLRSKKLLRQSLQVARTAGSRVGLIILSDEAARIPTSVYASADFVFRNYRERRPIPYKHFTLTEESELVLVDENKEPSSNPGEIRPDTTTTTTTGAVLPPGIDAGEPDSDSDSDSDEHSASVYWMPLGYTALTQYWERAWGPARLASARRLLWFFRGSSTSSSRQELMRVLSEDRFLRDKGVSGMTEGWGRGSGDEYTETMLESVFALCPQGWAAETFRMYEALVFGAIPVLQDDSEGDDSPYKVLGQHPLPVVRSWAEVPALLRHYYSRPHEMNKLQHRVIEWWDALADGFARQFAWEVLKGFSTNK